MLLRFGKGTENSHRRLYHQASRGKCLGDNNEDVREITSAPEILEAVVGLGQYRLSRMITGKGCGEGRSQRVKAQQMRSERELERAQGRRLDWNPDPGSLGTAHALTFSPSRRPHAVKEAVSPSLPQGCSGSLGHGSFQTQRSGARPVGEGTRGFL